MYLDIVKRRELVSSKPTSTNGAMEELALLQ